MFCSFSVSKLPYNFRFFVRSVNVTWRCFCMRFLNRFAVLSFCSTATNDKRKSCSLLIAFRIIYSFLIILRYAHNGPMPGPTRNDTTFDCRFLVADINNAKPHSNVRFTNDIDKQSICHFAIYHAAFHETARDSRAFIQLRMNKIFRHEMEWKLNWWRARATRHKM